MGKLERLALIAWLLSKGYSVGNIDFLMRQSALETGYWTSPAYVKDNNAFGMSKVRLRPTTQVEGRPALDGTGQNNTIGIYSSVYSSWIDRLMWDEYYGFDKYKSSEDYARLVGTKYHKSGSYTGSVWATNQIPAIQDDVDLLKGVGVAIAGLIISKL